jgi:hypothetical protein
MQIAIPCKPIHTLHLHKMYEPTQQNLLTNGTKISATKILEGRSSHIHRSSSCEYPRFIIEVTTGGEGGGLGMKKEGAHAVDTHQNIYARRWRSLRQQPVVAREIAPCVSLASPTRKSRNECRARPGRDGRKIELVWTLTGISTRGGDILFGSNQWWPMKSLPASPLHVRPGTAEMNAGADGSGWEQNETGVFPGERIV